MRSMARTLLTLLAMVSGSVPQVAAQTVTSITGRVVDGSSGAPVAGAEVIVAGAGVRVTDAEGLFQFDLVPVGMQVLRVSHVAYGTHEGEVEVSEAPLRVTVEVSSEAIRLAPLLVEGMSRVERERRGAGYQINRIVRAEIERYENTSMRLVDVLTAQIPGVRITRSGVVGQPTCLEFRGARAGNFIRGLGSSDPGCNSPEVYLDGVLVHNPATLFGTLPIEDIENIEVVPPSEAGARFGTGSMWGALIINTRWAWSASENNQPSVGYSRGPQRYDWSLETAPHQGRKVLLGAAVGNVLGLAAGVGVASRCISFRGAGDSLVSDCSATVTMGAAAVAMALPALGSALGARIAGSTDRSRGKFVAALIGAGVTLIPAYGVAMAGEHNDSNVLGTVGIVGLTVAVPLVATMADRLFRSSRPEN